MSYPAGIGKQIYYLPRTTRWSKGIGAELPEEFKKFWREWKLTQPSPVHYVPREGNYEKLADGRIVPIQNIPLPLKYPKELDEGIWGGEAVVQGFIKRHKRTRRYVRYWAPVLKRTILHSEILDKYMRTVVTYRTLNLIHAHFGFDHYVLNTPACDLRSLLALKLKRQMLISLYDKTLYPDDPVKREEVLAKYDKYLEKYTREEIEWYGLTYKEACCKHVQLKLDAYNPVPLKEKFRQDLLEELKIEEGGDEDKEQERSWLSKVNPFNRSSATP